MVGSGWLRSGVKELKISSLTKSICVAIAAGISLPAAAQDDRNIITAKQPAGIVLALLNAGYDATLEADDVGDPMIKFEGEGYKMSMLFYGCDEETNDDCDSVQLYVGFDRKQPWTAAEAIEIAQKYRYAAVKLDDEGDPVVSWDIVTGDGIPLPVFLSSIRRFESSADLVADLVFAEEDAEEGEAEAAM
ncbi:MAG: YbjN domain-containing protein [Erythrobacter sp.]|nr:YbjN domain-containing protein [Erythrobacter sp.]